MKYIIPIILALTVHVALGQSKHYILVLSKTEQKMVLLDYRSLQRVGEIPVGEDPHEVVTSPDGATAYVSIPKMNANGHEIDVLDLKRLKPLDTIDTRPFYIPHGLVYRNNKLWFTAQGSKSVVLFDLNTKQVEQVFGTGQDFTHLLYLSPDAERFYTTNVESGTLSIYEHKQLPPYIPPTLVLPANAKPRMEWRQTLVEVGLGAEGFDVTQDGKELWTARPDGKIVVVDLINKKVKAEIDSHVLGLHRLKITPDGKLVCIVSVKTGQLLYYDRLSHQLIQQAQIGQGAGIYMDKESNRMFVSCTPNNCIVVIDLATKKQITKIDIGRPDGVTAVLVN